MKYSEAIKHDIGLLKQQAFSNRHIARILGISKTGVSDYVLANKKPTSGPRVLVLDVETAATFAACFGRFDINLSQDNVLKEGGYILCASYRWIGSPFTKSIKMTPAEVASGNDKRIVKLLWQQIEQADAIVAHHGKAFDHKVIQARTLTNGLPPLPQVKVLDTLIIAKKYLKLPSNKLDSIGEYLGLGRKLDTGGIKLWVDVQSGDTKAMQQMADYCDQDVDLLYDIYLHIRKLGFGGDVVNSAIYYEDDKTRCSVCGSEDVAKTGRFVTTASAAYEEHRCNDCGAVHRGKTNVLSKDKRKALLTKT